MKKFIDYKTDVLKVSSNDERDEYLNLWKSAFGPKPQCNIEWYNWLNLDCPFGKNNLYIIREPETKKMISAYGLLPMTIVYNGEEHGATLCTNVMTHPDYGKRGLFTTIGKEALSNEIEKGATIQVGMPNDNAIRGHIKVGWERLPDLKFYEKTSNNFYWYIDDSPKSYRTLDRFDESMDKQIEDFHGKYNFYVKKDHKFLNWRYINHPYNKYTCFVLGRDSNPIRGYIVVKIFEENNFKKLHIVDYAYGNKSDLIELICIIELYARDNDVNLINLWKFDTSSVEDSTFEHNKYEKNIDSFDRLILYSDIDFFDGKLNDWHIVLGDNDVY